MIEQTSIMDYQDIKPIIGERHKEILKVLECAEAPLSDQMITRLLGKVDPNYVRPRRNELYKARRICKSDKIKCSVTGRTVWGWFK